MDVNSFCCGNEPLLIFLGRYPADLVSHLSYIRPFEFQNMYVSVGVSILSFVESRVSLLQDVAIDFGNFSANIDDE